MKEKSWKKVGLPNFSVALKPECPKSCVASFAGNNYFSLGAELGDMETCSCEAPLKYFYLLNTLQ